MAALDGYDYGFWNICYSSEWGSRKKFPCRRGVRQGDPFLPILFVAGADLLQTMVNQLADQGILIPPLSIPSTDFLIVQYADDTLLILQACPLPLLALKNLLQTFAAATGLRVNYAKSCLLLINVDDHQLHLLANTVGWLSVLCHLPIWGCRWVLRNPRFRTLLRLWTRLKED